MIRNDDGDEGETAMFGNDPNCNVIMFMYSK